MSATCNCGSTIAGQHSANCPLYSGYKADEAKDRHDLIPPQVTELLAHHYTIGAAKYQDHNWLKGMNYGRVYAALCRHLFAFWSGEDIDAVEDGGTGNHHMIAVIWGAYTLMYYELYREKYGKFDDRPWAKYPPIVDTVGDFSLEYTHESQQTEVGREIRDMCNDLVEKLNTNRVQAHDRIQRSRLRALMMMAGLTSKAVDGIFDEMDK